MGGANILGFLFSCAQRAAAVQNARLYLLASARALPSETQAGIKDFMPLAPQQVQCDGPLCALLDTAAAELLIFYRDLPATLRLLQIDAIGPTGARPEAADVPWFAYIPDFQHQYLPQFFSQQERLARDAHFRLLLEGAAGVCVNSATVAADIERFYPAAARRLPVLRLPQLFPSVAYSLPGGIDALLARYRIRRRYLLSCSQRWLHKRHDLIVEAFARIADAASDVDLVFTGETSDWRDPDYGPRVDALIARLGLASRVRVLGMIPRDEQLALIDHALAVIQASMFEGGPGASGTLEAALLGTPIVASDIAPNRELAFGVRRYFEAGSAEALAAALRPLLNEGGRARARPFDADQREVLAMASGLQFLAALRSAVR
jgi:glycosyltransferase involved in cell wall biosynthesis